MANAMPNARTCVCIIDDSIDDYYGQVRIPEATSIKAGDELRIEGAFSLLTHEYACAFALVILLC